MHVIELSVAQRNLPPGRDPLSTEEDYTDGKSRGRPGGGAMRDFLGYRFILDLLAPT